MATPKKQEAPKPSEKIQGLIEIGIPIRMAVFHRTILSLGNGKPGEPESALYSPENQGTKKSRTANMWLTPQCLVVEQNGVYKLIPQANVSDTIAL